MFLGSHGELNEKVVQTLKKEKQKTPEQTIFFFLFKPFEPWLIPLFLQMSELAQKEAGRELLQVMLLLRRVLQLH